MIKKLKILLLSLLPHHFLSRIIYKLTHSKRTPFLHAIMNWYIRAFKINMAEAKIENFKDYATMNALFTRALKPQARYFDQSPNIICAPADGCISAYGSIQHDKIIQAKNHNYTVHSLLGGLEHASRTFINGQFITIYLSPRDYHRVHMPYSGQLREMIHVPGRLFSVAPDYVNGVKGLFARNERIISIFDTELGPMALILVGAIFVSSIDTVWNGENPKTQRIIATDYSNSNKKIVLAKGEEMGRFNMGSTVILLTTNPAIKWHADLKLHAPLKMGNTLAKIEVTDAQNPNAKGSFA